MNRSSWTPMNIFLIIGIPFIACTLFGIFTIYNQSKQFNKEFAEERAQAQRLLDKRIAEKERHNQLAPLLHNPLDQTPEQPTEKPIYKDTATNKRVYIDQNGHTVRYYAPGEKHMFNWRYEDGIYKGMTYPEAYMAWKAKKDKNYHNFQAIHKVSIQIGRAMIDSANAKLSTILTIFKGMPPEELKTLKSEILKEYPEKADDVEFFFNDLANHDTIKSLEEIANDYQFILESDKAIWIAEEKNYAEYKRNKAERERLDSKEPIKPDFLQ